RTVVWYSIGVLRVVIAGDSRGLDREYHVQRHRGTRSRFARAHPAARRIDRRDPRHAHRPRRGCRGRDPRARAPRAARGAHGVTRHGDDVTRRSFPVPGRPGEQVTLAWAAVSDVGRRRQANEDSVIVQPPVFAVADGMGGHAAGDLASAAVVDRLLALAGRDDVDQGVVGDVLVLAAHDIDDLGEHLPLGAGTTVTGAVLDVAGAEP